MASQVEFHDFTLSDGKKVRVALLDNDGVRVSYRKQASHVSWHVTSRNSPNDDSITIITPNNWQVRQIAEGEK